MYWTIIFLADPCSLFAVGRFDDGVSIHFEKVPHQFPDTVVVVDDQDRFRASNACDFSFLQAFSGFIDPWKINVKGRAFSDLAID